MPWPLWVVGALALIGLAGLIKRRRPVVEAQKIDAFESANLVADPVVSPSAPVSTVTSLPESKAKRPRAALILEFHPIGARNTLIGAAVGYRLVLHNKGECTARDITIAALITNAEARQEHALASFFAASVEAPVHHVERMEPGSTVELKGELRLGNDAIVPIRVRDRSLLIPLVAFSAHYKWDETGRGYSGSAFIIGQESDPPRARMAPFRLDQGPKQYRSVGSRPALTALVN